MKVRFHVPTLNQLIRTCHEHLEAIKVATLHSECILMPRDITIVREENVLSVLALCSSKQSVKDDHRRNAAKVVIFTLDCPNKCPITVDNLHRTI